MSDINLLVGEVLIEGTLGRLGATMSGLGGAFTGGTLSGAHVASKMSAATGKASVLRSVGHTWAGSVPILGAVTNYIGHKNAEDLEKEKQNKS